MFLFTILPPAIHHFYVFCVFPESDSQVVGSKSSTLYIIPTASNSKHQESYMYENLFPAPPSISPTTNISQHVDLTSSRRKHVVYGASRYGCLVPALILAFLLTCVLLLSVLIVLVISGREREVRRDDSSLLCVSEEELKTDLLMNRSQQCDQCEQICLQRDPTQRERCSRCPDLWITINDKCYFFSENKKSRSLSDKDCAERGSRLATIKEEIIRALVTFKRKEFWVGLTHYNIHGGVWTGRWTDGSMENITEGTGSCAKLGHCLTLENCYTELNWICERDPV
ncbi:C-type lectin domain family 12 member B-like [Aquarana catesbeiana]|uniref:C-type lectin domain family 12 member B-like n=1 Tax=Aquarana catesbeiana TaxID=8400 RepID=UPI003CC9C90B